LMSPTGASSVAQVSAPDDPDKTCGYYWFPEPLSAGPVSRTWTTF
jgi:hypothetical protein